jgi:hypothetical protein
LECDYDDPVKSKMCPPITALYGNGSEEGETSNTEASVEIVKVEASEESWENSQASFFSTSTQVFLVDPDDP